MWKVIVYDRQDSIFMTSLFGSRSALGNKEDAIAWANNAIVYGVRKKLDTKNYVILPPHRIFKLWIRKTFEGEVVVAA